MMSIMEAAKRSLYSFVPSYMRSRDDGVTGKSEKKYPTSSLDGLRGIAALFVFFFHILFSYTNLVEYGYGQSPEQSRWIQLPFIRLLYSGHAMVIIFFVVGGYVFSLKPLKLVRSGQSAAFTSALVSSAFRRGIRLYAPAVIATFMTMITLYAGLWEYQRQFITEDRAIIYYADNHIERAGSCWAQLSHWLYQTKLLTNIFTYYNQGNMFPNYPEYDPHLWTIPIEFRSSMILTLCLLAFSQCRTAARLWLMLATTCFCIAWDRWELVCFLSGSMMCEIDLITRAFQDTEAVTTTNEQESKPEEDNVLPLHERTFFASSSRYLAKQSLRAQWPQIIAFIISLYLLSAPPLDMDATPGYTFIAYLTPPTYTDPKRWPHTIGTVLLIAALGRSSLLRRPFDTGIAQYLGKISLSLYIVHGPLIHVVGYRVTPWIWLNVTGMEGWHWAVGLLMGSAILAVAVAIVADWFWRVVESASVEWARRFEDCCRVSSNHCP